MARLVERLSDRQIKAIRGPGRFADGDGLYLVVAPSRTGVGLISAWVLRVRIAYLDPAGRIKRRLREMGLGSLHKVSLAEARQKARAARLAARDGDDPIEARDRALREKLAARQREAAEAAKAMTFRQCADAYLEAHKHSWRNEKHVGQWKATLKTYAYPVFGDVPVSLIDVPMVMKVLDPIWSTKRETARRVRGRIESILDWATVRGHRSGDNPARWRGHLQKAFPTRGAAQRVRHHAALPFDQVALFVSELREMDGAAARALEFAILTAARTGEVIGARWSEIDFENTVWTVPEERMKAGREHRVPLSPPAVKLLRELREEQGRDGRPPSQWVFLAKGGREPLSNMAMLMMLRRMKSDITVHGFRSTFRDWAAERTNFTREVAEAALAHTIGSKVEAAYRRGDLFDKRRKLMNAWGEYCERRPERDNVVEISGAVLESRKPATS